MTNNWQINAIAGLDGTQSRNQLNSDIKGLARNLDKLKLYAEIDKNQVTQLQHQLKNLQVQLNNVTVSDAVINGLVAKINAGLQNVNIGNINVGNIGNQAQQVGQQIGQQINQGVSSGVGKATTTVKSFSTLIDSMKSQKVKLNTEGLIDDKKTLDAIKQTYSEFGQVKITNKVFDSGELQSFKVNIEQVNGELKETRTFMMKLSENGKFFVFPDDVVKGTEKYVQHLNAAKNATNATGEALNAQNQRLAEQAKYYEKIKEETNHLYSLKQKLLSADELQTAELNKQIKSTKQRITYNNQQLDKKGLRDNSLEREINDLVVAREKQLALSDAKAQDTANTKAQAQAQREANAVLKEQQALQERVNKIQLLSNGGIKNDYATQIAKLEGNFRSLGLAQDTINQKTQNVKNSLATLRAEFAKPVDQQNFQTIQTVNDNLQRELIESTNEFERLRASMKGMATEQQRLSLANTIKAWNQKNTKATKEVREQNDAYVRSLRDLSTAMTRLDFNKINTGFKQNENSMRILGRLGLALKDQFTQAYRSFTTWLSASTMVMTLVTKIRQIPKEVIAVNSAMVELRKVTDASENDFKNYFDEAAESAKKLGTSISDLISATADWSRLGYSLDDSKKLAEIATLYKNVGDGIDVETANESLVSTLRGFQMEAEEAINVIDIFNEVANNMPISSGGIGDALQRSASSMYAAGNTLEETVALITAANSVVQDPDSIGTAYKTVSMRIRGAKTEMEELGLETEGMVESTATLQKEMLALTGIDIMQDKDTFKSTYDILDELADKWANLTDIQQASVTELIAGKRQGNIISALMTNFDLARESLDLALNSEGSALEEQKEYEKGIQYSLDRIKASFQEFANHILESSFLKGIVDFGNTTINVLDKVASSLGALGSIGLAGGLFAGIKNAGQGKSRPVKQYACPC